jgi:hypothetical protein
MNPKKQRVKRAGNQKSVGGLEEDPFEERYFKSARNDSRSYQQTTHDSLKKRVCNPKADLQFPKVGRLRTLSRIISEVLINHRSVSLACCNAVISEFVKAIERFTSRRTRRKSRTSPLNRFETAGHAIRRRFRAIRRFSIADILKIE